MNNLNTYIFIGRSGSGKGTQAKLLMEKLKSEGQTVLYVETGSRFREFINDDLYTNKLSRTLMENASSQPSFLAVKMWADALAEDFSGTEQVIFDGTPRSLIEAQVLETALNFFNFENRFVIYLNVSRNRSAEHLKERGRADDTDSGIAKRLDWFEVDVLPAIDYYRTQSGHRFIEVNGEESIESVHSAILEAL